MRAVSGGAADLVEAEVRELVRRRGLDPVADRGAVRRLVEDVVADYDERTLTSALPPLADTLSATRAVYDAVAGFGPLQRHLDDPTVEEIWVNERPGGEHHRVGVDEVLGERAGPAALEVEHHRSGTGGPHVVAVRRVAHEAGGGVPPLGEHALQQQRDLAVAAEEDDVAHAADATRGASADRVTPCR